MSEASDRQNSRATLRAERTTTSCGECRRRKQKCDQRQPCGNCARRFPQPPCEYRSARRTPTPSPPIIPTFDVSVHLDQFLEQPIPGTYDALLDAPRQPPWAKRSDGEVVRWSGVDLTTTYPTTTPPSSLAWEQGHPSRFAHGGGGTATAGEDSSPRVCDNNCKQHSAAIHDALKLLVHHYSIPDRFLGDRFDGLWNPSNIKDLLAWNVRPATGIPWPVGGPIQDLRTLPMAATRPNGELLRICQQHSHAPLPILSVADLLRTDLKLLCRFKASLDGNPDPNSPYMKHYVPHCVQDPMLLQIILYTSACFLNETGHVPRTVMMAHKGESIRMLNEHLRSDARQTSDSAIAGVVQLIVDEWYWGETQDLRAHLRGLREMIRLRGGFSQLGMSGFLAKNAITHDMAIALAHESEPFLQHGTEFDFVDPVSVPFKIAHNTPFVRHLPSFADCGRSLGLHPATATILDDMRFLFNAVLTLPAEPTAQQLQKVQTTCEWVHNRLLALDPVSPESRQASPRPSPVRAGDEGHDGRPRLEEPGRLAPAAKRRKSTSPQGSDRHNDYFGGGGSSEAGAGARKNHSPSSSSSRAALSPGGGTLGAGRRTPSPADGGSNHSASASGGGAGAGEASSTTRDRRAPDHLYQVVRHAALVYSRAIMTRTPIGSTCAPGEFLAIWTTMWRVPLAAWKAANGVFCWAVLAIAPCCHGTAHARFVKSMLIISVLGLGMDNWAVALEAARAGLRVQRWLSQRPAGGGGASSSSSSSFTTPSPPAAAAAGAGGGGGAARGDGLGPGDGGDEGVVLAASHGPDDQVPGVIGGGEAVEEHGYHQPEW